MKQESKPPKKPKSANRNGEKTVDKRLTWAQNMTRSIAARYGEAV